MNKEDGQNMMVTEANSPEDQFFPLELPFEEAAKRVLDFQCESRSFHSVLLETFAGIGHPWSGDWQSIPLTPIQAFREHILLAKRDVDTDENPSLEFRSSGTTGKATARHFISNPELLRESLLRGFAHFYGSVDQRPPLIGFLPGYVENPHSSLVHMIRILTEEQAPTHGNLPQCHTVEQLKSVLQPFQIKEEGVILFGAAFGFLDLLDHTGSFPLPEGSIVIETGGMKTYRREISKRELRLRLADGFRLPLTSIHSEFGMAEMCSQAYAQGTEYLEPVPWLKFHIRDLSNPFNECEPGEIGLLGFTDLANLHSCPFVLTEDLAEKDEQGRIRVLGRWKNADLRGCNFLIERDA